MLTHFSLSSEQELTDLIANIACDTSFLFFSRELFPSCLADIYSRPDEVRAGKRKHKAHPIDFPISADNAFDCFCQAFLHNVYAHLTLPDPSVPISQAQRLPILVAAFRASQKILLCGTATPELLEGFEAEMQLALEEEILGPLCTDVETDLRLHIHSARLTGVVDVNPVQSGVKDLSQFLRIPPMRLLTKEVRRKGAGEERELELFLYIRSSS